MASAAPSGAPPGSAGSRPSGAPGEQNSAGDADALLRPGAAYLDYNATALMESPAIRAMAAAANMGNPSSDHAAARAARAVLDDLRGATLAAIGWDPAEYVAVLTSGASEANALAIEGLVRKARSGGAARPGVAIGATEHKSVAGCAARLAADGLAAVATAAAATAPWSTRGPDGEREARGPDGREGQVGGATGEVTPAALGAALDALGAAGPVALASVMAANNETGVVHDVAGLAAEARRRGVPLHVDACQSFGKEPWLAAPADACSVSYHKLGAPPGIGALAIRRRLADGLAPLVAGTQNGGLRGGTENLPGAAGALAALLGAMGWPADWRGHLARCRAAGADPYAARRAANARLARMRAEAAAALRARVPTVPYADAVRAGPACCLDRGRPAPTVVLVSPPDARTLPNTLFLSVVYPRFCNRAARAALERRGVFVSVGSACNSADPHASGPVQAMGTPQFIADGVLRVSAGDPTSAADWARFVATFARLLGEMRAGSPEMLLASPA
jgi:cysteine desulfurase